MLFKRALILVLTLITAVSLIGCGSSQAPAADTPVATEPATTEQVSKPTPAPAPKSTPTPEPTTPPVDYSIFDGTYWFMTFGPTNGTVYAAKFNDNGTFTAVCCGSLLIFNGTYTYDGSSLIVSVDRYDNIEFVRDGDGFTSVEEYVAQVYYHYHAEISKSDKESFDRQLEFAQNQG